DQSDVYEYADFRGEESKCGTDPDEIFANQFAAELLMPADEVKKLHAQGNPSYVIAHHFGVSDDAINYRLINLKLT
ncbi:ImmA/IrrE family metallo-endopeptidase, partial [Escherichia coli]